MSAAPQRRKHRGGRRHFKLKQRRQVEHEARLQQESGAGGCGGGPGVQPETALFERPEEIRSDIRLTRRAVKQRWATDPHRGEQILEKVSRQALGEEDVPPFSPGQLLATAKLHLEVQRLNQTDEHHADKLDLAERSLQAKLQADGFRPGSAVSVQASAPASVTIYIPDNGRDPSEVDPADEA